MRPQIESETAYDIYSRLLENRIVFLGDVIADQMANFIIAQLLFLEAKDPERDVTLYVNSPGGIVTSGLAIYETMQRIRPEVGTVCIGTAGGTAVMLLAGGASGKRAGLPSSQVVLVPATSPSGAQAGSAGARELQELNGRVHTLVARHTGRALADVASASVRGLRFNALQAQAFGVIDIVYADTDPSGPKRELVSQLPLVEGAASLSRTDQAPTAIVDD